MGSRWVLNRSTSPANHQKLNVIQKQAFYFLAAEGWQMDFESIDQLGWSLEVECNPKTSILFLWLERGGRRGSSQSTSPADHQKLNVIQKWAFYFLTGEGWQMGFKSIDQPSQSSEVEQSKISILFFGCRGVNRVQVHWLASQSSEVERNPKTCILFFGCRGVADGFRVHRPAQPIIRSWM